MAWNPALQGLRGLAVLLVLVYHLHRGVLTGSFGVDWPTGGPVFDALELGRLGVDLFFLLSGYLIVGSLAKHGRVGAFLVNRARRIYPAFVVPHLAIFACGPLLGYSWMTRLSPLAWCGHFVSNLLFLPGVVELPVAQIVAWSLSYEAAFYLLAAAGFAIVSRGDRHVLPKLIFGGLWLVAAGVFLSWHPRAWFFVGGVTVYLLERRGTALPVGGATGLVAFALMIAAFDRAFPLAVVAGTVGLLSITRCSGWSTRLLDTPFLRYTGAISFSLYLWHSMVLFVTKRLFVAGRLPFSPTVNLVAYAVVSIVASYVAAHLSYVVMERWFTERVLVRRRATLPTVPFAPPTTDGVPATDRRAA
jgi:peptidoglycan/LPS O-acetylase OafA/YrhL